MGGKESPRDVASMASVASQKLQMIFVVCCCFLGIHGVTDDLRIGHSSGFAVCKPTDQMSSCTTMRRPSENFSVCNLNNLTDDVACTTKKKDVVAVIRHKITFEKKKSE